MHKELLLFTKYPYTAGVIATIWIGTAILIAINPDVPSTKMVIIDVAVSVVLAVIGFASKDES